MRTHHLHFFALHDSITAAAADYAGKVAALGPGTESKGLKVGDPVYGFMPADIAMKNGRGSLSKKLLVDQAYVELIPSNYTPEQAAGLTLVGLTALQLADFTKPGDRVLVAGGSTSVGLLLIKMLKAKGMKEIVATGSGSKVDVIKSRGADHVVDCEYSVFLPALVQSNRVANHSLTSPLCQIFWTLSHTFLYFCFSPPSPYPLQTAPLMLPRS